MLFAIMFMTFILFPFVISCRWKCWGKETVREFEAERKDKARVQVDDEVGGVGGR